jgi:hypothetical protein
MQTPMLPYKILVLAPFKAGEVNTVFENRITVNKDELDIVLSELGVALYVPIPQNLCPAGGIDLQFKSMKDFHPDGILANNPFLRNLMEAGKYAVDAPSQGFSDAQIVEKLNQWQGIPKLIQPTTIEKPAKKSEDAINNILDLVALPEERPTAASPLSPKTQIDTVVNQVLDHIFADEGFQELERVWRGLQCLIKQVKREIPVEIEIQSVTQDSLQATIGKFTAELMDDLPSLVLVDIGFDNSARSLEMLESVAVFSETLMLPSVVWLSHRFFYLTSWNDIKTLGFLPNHIDDPAYAKWRRLKESSEGKWVVALCNRFLNRYPYGPDNKPRSAKVKETDFPWTSPVWAFGAMVCQSIGLFGWPTHISDWHRVLLEDLALCGEDPLNPIPTEANFTRDRIEQFLRIGIMPLVGRKKQDTAFFPDETTVGGEYFSYQILLSRVTHLILWCQDNFPKTLSPEELKKYFEKAVSKLFEGDGGIEIDQLEIQTKRPTETDRISVHISVKPSRKVLHSGKRIEMDFLW